MAQDPGETPSKRVGRLTTDVMLSALSPRAKLLAPVLDWHAPNIRPGTERLAVILGCSERMVRYYRRELLRWATSGETERAWWTERRKRRFRDRQRVAVEQHPLGSSTRDPNPDQSRPLKGGCSTATGCRPPRVIPGPWGAWDDGDETGVLFGDPGGDGRGWPEPRGPGGT
jgi:hypothetical protein